MKRIKPAGKSKCQLINVSGGGFIHGPERGACSAKVPINKRIIRTIRLRNDSFEVSHVVVASSVFIVCDILIFPRNKSQFVTVDVLLLQIQTPKHIDL